VATHDYAERNCKRRRITLLLDLDASCRLLKAGGMELPLSDSAPARRRTPTLCDLPAASYSRGNRAARTCWTTARKRGIDAQGRRAGWTTEIPSTFRFWCS
jgi:hypothetical protein